MEASIQPILLGMIHECVCEGRCYKPSQAKKADRDEEEEKNILEVASLTYSIECGVKDH